MLSRSLWRCTSLERHRAVETTGELCSVFRFLSNFYRKIREPKRPAAQNEAAEVKIRAERKAGELLAAMKRNQGQRTDLTSRQPDEKLTFEQQRNAIGVSEPQSRRWQLEATLPCVKFAHSHAHRATRSAFVAFLAFVCLASLEMHF